MAINLDLRRQGFTQPGMWTMSDQGLGIIAVERDGAKWMHLVNDDGGTLAALPLDRCKNVRIAKAAEIPLARVQHLTKAQLASFGYI